MSLSRVLAPGKAGPKVVAVTSVRTDINLPKYYDHDKHQKLNQLVESFRGTGVGATSANVGLVGRLIARFQGRPLPGEKEAPEALFKDMGLHFMPAEPLPAVPDTYKEHPERDVKNFPFPVRNPYPLKTRFMLLPDSWFQAFYNVTGSSGGYAFMGAFGAFCVNKEYLMWDEGVAIIIWGWMFWYMIIRNAWGPKLDAFGYGMWKERIDKHRKVIEDDKEAVQNFKKIQAARKDALVTAKEYFPAILEENNRLQLEVTYRKNIEKVATELKRRLDYLKETETVKQRLERTIYLREIIEGVKKQIENNENGIKDAYLDYCIDQLRGLAAKEGGKA